MCVVTNYEPVEGVTLPEHGYYSIPDQYKHLPIKKRKYNITSWGWYQEMHGDTISKFLQDGYDSLAGVKGNGGGVIGMHISKAGDNWPKEPCVSIADIEIKRVHYYLIVHDLNDDWERYPKVIIDDFDDVAFYVG